ncbi:CoA transferase subunit A [Niveispirillum sp.]|uniref:CoA transferase subunit A n=1 Tax=Niveispirillum sp. TaxID=1917217 RepID=UPI001B6CEEC4|nr:3-oxoacid CoA-transferase subunit A [Niveispirillum sp.]MBP7336544.1 3-oxoacid CoA-transferase subunit A [Niveispirillum sp.]
MTNKIVNSVAEALSGIDDGASVMIAGFGLVGQPDALINGLIERGVGDLTLIMNNAGMVAGVGASLLLELGRVRKIICSFPRAEGNKVFGELYSRGRIELELVPQGTLAERIRAAGAGIGGFYTPTAAGTMLAEGKEVRVLNGVPQVLELPLHADVALLQAWRADPLGNLTYRGTGRNFNPIMATAARLSIVETCHLAGIGELDPEMIVTPGIYIDRIVHVAEPRLSAGGN